MLTFQRICNLQGVHRAVHGSDTSTMREASSNSERATGSQELLPADRGWAAVSPPNSAVLLCMISASSTGSPQWAISVKALTALLYV